MLWYAKCYSIIAIEVKYMTATKHEQILKYIEALPVGTKVSVRQIAKELEVSEGTAYRAIKQAENVGLVSSIPKVATIRIEKPVKKQLEVDFICNKGSKKYYIQSAYMLETEAKMAQEIRPFLKINDSFKKIVITSNTPKPFYNDQGILIMNVYDFLLNVESLKL